MISSRYKGTATSLRWDVIDGRIRRYPNGREVCLDTPAGKAEYAFRTEAMRMRQHNICGRGPHIIVTPTFDHSTRGRGAGGANRDDRIEDENGNPMNCCSCWKCNGAAGSKRL